MNYLCELQAMKIIQDSLNNTVKSIFDSQYQVLDSAKLFEVRNADNDFSDYYIFKGTYKSDGILKSANSFKKLPIQYADSITLLQVDQINVETFAFCKNKQWKLLCVNLLKSEEFIILQDFTFNSLHDIRKLLYPYNISGSDCIDSKEKQLIKRKFEELSEKASDKVQW
jgi:hypothetical protein